MKKKILSILTAAICFAGVMPVNAAAENSDEGIVGLQEEGGSSLISGEQSVGVYVDNFSELSEISETAEADTAKLIIDESYSSDIVSSSCTIKSLGRDLTIDAGDNDIIVLLDEAVLEKTLTVKADKGSVTFFLQGSLVCGKESKGIVWHEICDGCKITDDKYIPICFYGSEDSVITLNDETVLCGSLRLPYTVLDDRSSGAFNIEYVSEYDNKAYAMKPSIIGNVLLKKLMNDEIVFAFCYGKAETGDVYAEPEYRIVKLPDKVEYNLGEMIDLKGLEIEVTKANEDPVVYSYPDVAFDYQSNIPKAPRVILHSDFRSDKAGAYKVEVVGADNVCFDVEVVDDSAIKDLAVFEEGEIMTLDDVIELSKKGNALTLSDFAKFKGVIAGSGIFILEYDLGNGSFLRVGSGDLCKIDYARLKYTGIESYIDIRTDDVEAIIAEVDAKTLTIDDVKELAQKGDALVWSDFDEYIGEDGWHGTGMYTHTYSFDLGNGYVLYVGGNQPSKPEIILLYRYDPESGIDIRKDDIKDFIFMTDDQVRIVKILEISYDALLVIATDCSGEIMTLPTKYLDSDILPKEGMELEVTYVGGKFDTYPAEFGEVKKVTVVSNRIEIDGDANCDGGLDLADAVLIMQALANPNKYGIDGIAENHLTELGRIKADMNGDGLTVGDAQAIQRKLLGLDDEKSEDTSKLSDMVSIKTPYRPAMSDWSGIGILLEFDSKDYSITLSTNEGHFTTWDIETGDGVVTNVGKTYDIGNSGYIFWTPDDLKYSSDFVSEITVKGKNGDAQIELGKIYVTMADNGDLTALL